MSVPGEYKRGEKPSFEQSLKRRIARGGRSKPTYTEAVDVINRMEEALERAKGKKIDLKMPDPREPSVQEVMEAAEVIAEELEGGLTHR